MKHSEVIKQIWENLISEQIEHFTPYGGEMDDSFLDAFNSFINKTQTSNTLKEYEALAYWAQFYRASKNPNVNEEYRHNPNNPLYEKLYQCITYKYPQILNYWLTPLQLDREFHISLSLQKQFISSSSMLNLPYQKIGGKFVCYKRDKIIAWLKKNKIQDRQCCIQN